MHTRIKIAKITITKKTFEQIRQTIGSLPAETGGVLGGDPTSGQITDFFFDEKATRSPVIYTVSAERINPVLEQWNAEGVHLCGMIHSHPPRMSQPSSQDVEFATRLLHRKDNSALPRFLIPIIQSSADGAFEMRMFAVTRELNNAVFEVPFEIVEAPEDAFAISSPVYRRTFARVRTSYDLNRLYNSLICGIGCGGAFNFYTDLARCGVGNFFLLDPDLVEESNLATSGHSRKDLGRPKVDAVKDQILDINPLATVITMQKPIEALTDSDFRDLIFAADGIETHVLCGMTDSFWAQMRVNLLALNFGMPALSGQIYKGGRAAEVVFTHPQTTKACMRCILSQRYRAFLEQGFQNDAGSEGAQYLATARLNATKLYVALALLHYGTEHSLWGLMLERIGQRNFVLGRMDPDFTLPGGRNPFENRAGGFADDTVWRPQQPENQANGYKYDCPDCAGTGVLTDCIGKFKDTAEIVAQAKVSAARNFPTK